MMSIGLLRKKGDVLTDEMLWFMELYNLLRIAAE
jgi:hypothetical protein